MQASLQDKYDHLRTIVGQAGTAIIAFSGGVDSTFLLKVCVDMLGEKALAITARSETFPKRELQEAEALAERIGALHLIIDTEELAAPGFSNNPPHRCFLCKSELFSKLKQIAKERRIPWVFDPGVKPHVSLESVVPWKRQNWAKRRFALFLECSTFLPGISRPSPVYPAASPIIARLQSRPCGRLKMLKTSSGISVCESFESAITIPSPVSSWVKKSYLYSWKQVGGMKLPNILSL